MNRKIMFIAVSVLILSYVSYTVLRSMQLLAESKKLYVTSSGFSRDYYIGSPLQDSLLIVALGDSTIEGTGAMNKEESLVYAYASGLTKYGQSAHVLNFGISGARMQDLSAQIKKIADLKPNVVLVGIGANDATHFTSREMYKNSLEGVVESFKKLDVNVLWATAPDLAYAPALPRWFRALVSNRASQQNADLVKITAGTSIKIVDIYQRGKLDYAKDSSLYASDLFHPSVTGYASWVSLFVKAGEKE